MTSVKEASGAIEVGDEIGVVGGLGDEGAAT